MCGNALHKRWQKAALFTCVLSPFVAAAEPRPGINWPSFRGPAASGVADGFPLPTTWNVESGESIRWKTPIAGLAYSCPAVWGDHIYLTTAVPDEGDSLVKVGLYGSVEPVNEDKPFSFRVLCLDKKSGRVLWDKEAHKGVPKIKRHPKSSHANSTPATDGKHVVAFFGAEGLYCYDTKGELLWKKDLGPLDAGWYVAPEMQWGFASSPIIDEDKVIVQCDVQKNSFVAALSLKDGSEIWRTPRDEVPTWCTPTVHRSGERAQVICNGYKHTGGYDLSTGRELWKLKGGGDIPVPTPIVAHDLIFFTSAHGEEAPIYAVRVNAEGDITPEAVGDSNEYLAWSKSKRGTYMQTPLVYGDVLYTCRDNGIFTTYEARTGKQLVRERVGDGSTGFTASAVAGDGKLYLTSEEGDIHVFQTGTEYKPLTVNKMNEVCMATPAISEGLLLIRTQRHLVAVGK